MSFCHSYAEKQAFQTASYLNWHSWNEVFAKEEGWKHLRGAWRQTERSPSRLLTQSTPVNCCTPPTHPFTAITKGQCFQCWEWRVKKPWERKHSAAFHYILSAVSDPSGGKSAGLEGSSTSPFVPDILTYCRSTFAHTQIQTAGASPAFAIPV